MLGALCITFRGHLDFSTTKRVTACLLQTRYFDRIFSHVCKDKNKFFSSVQASKGARWRVSTKCLRNFTPGKHKGVFFFFNNNTCQSIVFGFRGQLWKHCCGRQGKKADYVGIMAVSFISLVQQPAVFELDMVCQTKCIYWVVARLRAPAMQKGNGHTSASMLCKNCLWLICPYETCSAFAKQVEGQRRGWVFWRGTSQDQRCRARAPDAMEGYPSGDAPKVAESATTTKDGNS